MSLECFVTYVLGSFILSPTAPFGTADCPTNQLLAQREGKSLDTTISRMVYFYVGYKVKLLPPAVQFLNGLHDRLKAKAARSIRLLQEFGPSLREPHSKKVTDWPGLFELRVMLGHDACRFFYFWHQEHLYVVTSGYMKKGIKLDRRELERAAVIMRQHIEGTKGTI